jgi:hypothetical protein
MINVRVFPGFVQSVYIGKIRGGQDPTGQGPSSPEEPWRGYNSVFVKSLMLTKDRLEVYN